VKIPKIGFSFLLILNLRELLCFVCFTACFQSSQKALTTLFAPEIYLFLNHSWGLWLSTYLINISAFKGKRFFIFPILQNFLKK